MTENKGDLISREALKETIIEPLNVNDVCKNDWYEGYYTAKNEDIMAIDNAPTVELERPQGEITEEDIQNAIKTGYENGYSMAQAKYQRPQGEWITFPTNHSIIQCPECTALISNLRVDVFKDKVGKMNYCPNCGADMRGEDNGKL